MNKHEAPRLETYWTSLEGHLLRMLRKEWEKYTFPHGSYVKIDLNDTPLESLAKKTEFIGAVGRRISPTEVEILAYRRDPKDDPCEINVYRYLVMESWPARLDLQEAVQTADTDFDANLQGYLTDYIFITITFMPPGQHHLKDVTKDIKKGPRNKWFMIRVQRRILIWIQQRLTSSWGPLSALSFQS